MIKHYKKVVYGVITITTVPFFLLLTHIDFTLAQENISAFWVNLSLILGDIFGFIGIMLLMWQFVLGIRYIARFISPDILLLNKIHNLIGKYGILFIIVHPLLVMYGYFEKILWIVTPSFSTKFNQYISFGRIAFLTFLFIWTTSILLKKKLHFRPWQYLHYISYPLMVFALLHPRVVGTYTNMYGFIRGILFICLVLFALLCVFRLFMYSGLGKKKFRIQKIKFKNDILLITVKPMNSIIKPKPGQYCYLQIHGFGEAHPFSVVHYDTHSHNLTFGIKIMGNFTKKLSKVKQNKIINIDGPYGVFTREGQNDDPKVIIAGGIGVAPFVDLILSFGKKNTLMFNANRFEKDIIYKQKLIGVLGNNYYDFLSRDNVKGNNIINGHLDKNSIINIVHKDKLLTYKYFVCGSGSFIKAMVSALHELQINRNQIFFENFGD